MHLYKVGTRVRHIEKDDVYGTIVSLKTLFDVDQSCEEQDDDDPWYEIKWDHGQFVGQEAEGSLVRIFTLGALKYSNWSVPFDFIWLPKVLIEEDRICVSWGRTTHELCYY